MKKIRLTESELTRLIKKVIYEQEVSFSPKQFETADEITARLNSERAKKTEAETSFTYPTLPSKIEPCTNNQKNEMIKAYSNNNLSHIIVDDKFPKKSFIVFTKNKIFCRCNLDTIKLILT